MTITKTALAAAILAVMAVSAQAQQGPTRQIQVLPAPGAQVKAPAVVQQAAVQQAPAQFEGQAPQLEAPAAEASPAPEVAPEAAPKLAPKFAPAPKFVEVKPEPKIVIEKPVRKAFGYAGYGKRGHICH
jgi:hypothetical protein